jgi:DNA repair exonuclease SbcCD ATPase subunit
VSVAAGRIEQVISLRGQDNASKVVEDVKGSFRGLAVSAENVAEKSGDIEQGLRGVKDIAGDLLGDQMKGLLDVAGGIEATIKGFGPAFGPIGIALAAAGAAAAYFYSEAKKAREAIIDARIKELENAKESQEATAKILGVNADILGVVSKKLTVDEQIAENQKAAQKILDNQIKQQEAIKDEEDEQLETLKREETQLRRNLEIGAQQLEQAKQLADRRAAAEAAAVRFSTERLEREAQINAIQDQRERLNARSRLRGEDLAKVESQLADLATARVNTGQRELDTEKRRQDLIKQRIALESEDRADAAAGQALREARLAKQRAAADKAAAETRRRRDEEKKAEEDRRKETLETVEKFLKGEEQAEQELAAAKIAAAKGVERAELAIAEIRRKAANEREVLSQTSELTEVARAKKLAALELQTANEVATVQKALADEELREKEAIAAAKAKIAAKEREDADKIKQKNKEIADSQRATWESLNALVGPAVAALSGENGIGRAIGEVLSQSQKLAAQWKGEGVGAEAIVGSVGAVASAVVEGEKEKAAILALTSAAQAAVYFATGQIPQGIAATSAAALYAAAAGGLVGGGSSAPSAGSAGGFAASPSMGGGGGGGGAAIAGATTVINFNAPLGTPYEIGKSVAKAQKAASAGGWSPRMAMGV